MNVKFGFKSVGIVCALLCFPVLSFALNTEILEGLIPLFEVKKAPGPYDWLAQHKESGQTYSDYAAARHAVPDVRRPYIYIALLGDFSDEQKRIVESASRYIQVYFQTTVQFSDPISLSLIPAKARRIHPQTGDAQVLSTYVIEEVLKARMPKDAFAYVAFTSSDLWPGEGWNFVFGQASMEDRIGVWSIFRNGDPQEDYARVLRRTIQTGTHEVGHLFGLDHCIFYECNMNGSNSRAESDKRPLWDCPVCLRKLSNSTNFDVVKRYRELMDISNEFGFKDDAIFFEKILRTLEKR